MTTDALDILQRIRSTRARPSVRAGERCEVCAVPIEEEHGHLVDLRARNLMCACRGCYLLFTGEGAGGMHFRAVPDRYRAFPDLELSAAQWDALQIPVSVAFFFINSELGRVAAFYPGPAGATESLLALETWEEIVASDPELRTLAPDVEAFLVRAYRADGAEFRSPKADRTGAEGAMSDRADGAEFRSPKADRTGAEGAMSGHRDGVMGDPEFYLVPIDACYELVGRLRQLWRGFDGGSEAHRALDDFFARVRERAR